MVVVPAQQNATANHTMPTLRLTLPSEQQPLGTVALIIPPAAPYSNYPAVLKAAVAVVSSAEYLQAALVRTVSTDGGTGVKDVLDQLVAAVDCLVDAVVDSVVRSLDNLQNTATTDEVRQVSEVRDLSTIAAVLAVIVLSVHLQNKYM